MRTLLVAFCLLAAPTVASAQDCAALSLFSQGSHQVRASYDGKGKEVGRTSVDVTGVTTSGAAVTAAIHSVAANAKGKETGTMDYTMTCEAGTVTVDMKSLVPSESTEAYKDFQMTMEGDQIAWPATVTAGQTLPDATLTMTFTMPDAPPMMPATTMVFVVKNRVVEGPESVTTPAGTFDTWKVRYDVDVVTKGMMSMTTSTSGIDWFTPGVGSVKTETYQREKLATATLLVESR